MFWKQPISAQKAQPRAVHRSVTPGYQLQKKVGRVRGPHTSARLTSNWPSKLEPGRRVSFITAPRTRFPLPTGATGPLEK
ncbi:hypothetical protein CHARACLAT_002934 [Characodon lateralis]|uniref:Uncharacterized protein n=1 Tax=Characodon lateralis TaxID=208331 RepID=A0ABU7CWK6_9TELE|nr:hypothetical protein [Characodon lateralis]